jgi:hypothetical protein
MGLRQKWALSCGIFVTFIGILFPPWEISDPKGIWRGWRFADGGPPWHVYKFLLNKPDVFGTEAGIVVKVDIQWLLIQMFLIAFLTAGAIILLRNKSDS